MLVRHRALLVLSVIVVSLCGCDLFGGKNESDNSFSETKQSFEEAAQQASQINSDAQRIIENKINENTSGNIDVQSIASEVSAMDKVESTDVSSSGASISLDLKSGITSNILLARQDRRKLFKRSDTKRIDQSGSRKDGVAFKSNKDIYPGNERALLLLPFQTKFLTFDSFSLEVSELVGYLESGGYSVDVLRGSNAGIEKFKGSFLSKYGFIYIHTHGAVGKDALGNKTTAINTGTDASGELPEGVTEYVEVAVMDSDYAIKPSFIQETMDGKEFSNSWVFISACESAKIDNGDASFSEMFFDNGAAAFGGFDKVMNLEIAEAIGENLTSELSAGNSLDKATKYVKNDINLSTYEWAISITGTSSTSVKDLDTKNPADEPFRILRPSSLVLDLGTHDGSQYYISKQDVTRNWNQSRNIAESLGGHLVTISDQEEEEFIIPDNAQEFENNAWIGLTDKENEGDFQWVTDEDLSYTNWCSGEPNDLGTEDAVILRLDQECWNDGDIVNDYRGFVVEVEQ